MHILSNNNDSTLSQGNISFDNLLDLCIDTKASDIHLAEDEKIALRINGNIKFVDNSPILNKEQAENLIFGMITNPKHKEKLKKEKDLDISYQHKDGTNFRVNIYYKRGRLASALRIIGRNAYPIDELGIPPKIKDIIAQDQGMILVTGLTGAGKSTTLQSILEHINETRVEHIITIEDPIEFVFKNNKSIFSQREIGQDTNSFSNALRAVVREDPDIVMIGEMRDTETIKAAMNLAETGHLVFSTLHTSGGTQTIQRLVNAFPIDQHEQIQTRLAETLIGILSQRLVPRTDDQGRIAIIELLIINPAIRNIIRTGELAQLNNAILAGRDEGMITMRDYAYALTEQGLIKEEDYIHFFNDD